MKFVKNLVSVIKQMLVYLKDSGYDRIHISGGTSLDGCHYSGIIGYEYDAETKDFYFVGLPYNSEFHKLNDAPTATKRLGETPIETALREFFEETGLKAKAEDLIPVLMYPIKDNRPERQGQKHHKHFFMVDLKRCSGELYSFEGPNPIDGETAAPLLIPVSLFVECLFPGHLGAVKKAMEKLSEQKEYAFALMNMMS